MDVCTASHAEGQLLVLLHCAKLPGQDSTVGAIRIVAHSFPWCQWVKKKTFFDNANFCLFEDRLASAALAQGVASKTTIFQKLREK